MRRQRGILGKEGEKCKQNAHGLVCDGVQVKPCTTWLLISQLSGYSPSDLY